HKVRYLFSNFATEPEIVTYHIDDSIYEGDFKINPHALQAVSRLAGNDYAKLGGIFTIKRPEK
ncbi:TPA: hypothetical protein PBS38_001884, partial [Staphylococcus aureus]|nr:hypothetical protein [Staphylococcus aureus]